MHLARGDLQVDAAEDFSTVFEFGPQAFYIQHGWFRSLGRQERLR